MATEPTQPKEVKTPKVEKPVDETKPRVASEPKESFEDRTQETTPWKDENGNQVTGAEDVTGEEA